MAKIALPYTIINGDPVDAGPVESNYQTIENHANQELIERGGTVAMAAQLKLVGNPVAALDAAPKQYVDQMLPIGIITMFGGAVAPLGGVWLACDNTEYEVAIYPELATVLGNAVSGKFRVPNLKDRFPVGSGGAYAANAIGGSPDAVNVAHAHSIDHTHGLNGTSAADTNHYHGEVGHAHGVNLYSSYDGSHSHVSSAPNSSGFVVTGTSGNAGDALIAVGGNSYVVQGGTSVGIPDTHRHATNGTSDNTNVGTTWIAAGSPGNPHSHTSQTPTFNGASAQAGETGVGKNIPPYCAVLYVIRAK